MRRIMMKKSTPAEIDSMPVKPGYDNLVNNEGIITTKNESDTLPVDRTSKSTGSITYSFEGTISQKGGGDPFIEETFVNTFTGLIFKRDKPGRYSLYVDDDVFKNSANISVMFGSNVGSITVVGWNLINNKSIEFWTYGIEEGKTNDDQLNNIFISVKVHTPMKLVSSKSKTSKEINLSNGSTRSNLR